MTNKQFYTTIAVLIALGFILSRGAIWLADYTTEKTKLAPIATRPYGPVIIWPKGEPYRKGKQRVVVDKSTTCIPGRDAYCVAHLYVDGVEVDYHLWMEVGK